MKNLEKNPVLVSATTALIVSSLALVAFLEMRSPATTDSHDDRYEQILSRGFIEAGYYVGAPYLILDPNKDDSSKDAFSGIFFEVMEEVAKSLNLKIRWKQEVSFPDMAESLNDGRVDIIGSGIWISAARARNADFTIPVIYDAVCAYVRPDDERFQPQLSNLNMPKFKIATIDGEMAAAIANTDFPNAQKLELPQLTPFSDLMLNVRQGKADITFLGIAAAQDYLSQHPNSLKNATPTNPLRVFPTAVMLPKSQYALKRALDNAILELVHSGRLESIIKKYEAAPESHYRVAPSYVLPTQ